MNGRKRAGILAGGSWLIDHVKIIDQYPALDGVCYIEGKQTTANGGSPYNLLTDLSLLKASFSLEAVGLVGNDSDGEFIIEDLKKRAVDVSQMYRTDEAPTSFTDVFSEKASGRRTFFHQKGTNALVDESHFDFAQSEAKIFHLGYLLLLDHLDLIGEDGLTGSARLLKRAGEAGFLTSVDVVSEDSSRVPEVVLPTLPYVDFLVINEFEAGRITGISTHSEGGPYWQGIEKAAEELLESGVRQWVVIHFPEGALAKNKEGEVIRSGSLNIPKSFNVGSSGAGDAFAAGVLYGIHEEMPMVKCLEIAVCSAAMCLSHPTTSFGLKSLPECLELIERFGLREVH
jgi:sugar/nucleoside kinase (ribokinase family)